MIKRILCVLALLLSVSVVWGQTSFVSLPSDARTAAMGGATSALGADAFAPINNMASTLSSQSSLELGVSYMNWQPQFVNANIMSAAGYYKISDDLAVGASFQYEMLPSQEIISSSGTASGEFTPQGNAVGVGVAYALSERLSLGATAKYNSTKLYTLSQSAIMADVALNYKAAGGDIAVTLSNLGGSGSELELPTSINVASGSTILRSGEHEVDYGAKLGYIFAPESISSLVVGLGLEYSYSQKYFARFGSTYYDSTYLSPWGSAGVGINVEGCRVDVAYMIPSESDSPIKGSWMLSASFGF